MEVRWGRAAGERGTAVGPTPQPAACPQHCMLTPCRLMHGCHRAVPVVVRLAGLCRGAAEVWWVTAGLRTPWPETPWPGQG